jgi:hypothetical protein
MSQGKTASGTVAATPPLLADAVRCPRCRRPMPPPRTACGPCLALMWVSRSLETLAEGRDARPNDEKARNCP